MWLPCQLSALYCVVDEDNQARNLASSCEYKVQPDLCKTQTQSPSDWLMVFGLSETRQQNAMTQKTCTWMRHCHSTERALYLQL